MKSYTDLLSMKTYKERLEYLKLSDILPGAPGKRFHMRNRKLWDRVREKVIARDLGFDLGVPGKEIVGSIIVHHINPVTDEMYGMNSPMLYDPDNLITVSRETHDYIHYGTIPQEPLGPRSPGDTKLW